MHLLGIVRGRYRYLQRLTQQGSHRYSPRLFLSRTNQYARQYLFVTETSCCATPSCNTPSCLPSNTKSRGTTRNTVARRPILLRHSCVLHLACSYSGAMSQRAKRAGITCPLIILAPAQERIGVPHVPTASTL